MISLSNKRGEGKQMNKELLIDQLKKAEALKYFGETVSERFEGFQEAKRISQLLEAARS